VRLSLLFLYRRPLPPRAYGDGELSQFVFRLMFVLVFRFLTGSISDTLFGPPLPLTDSESTVVRRVSAEYLFFIGNR